MGNPADRSRASMEQREGMVLVSEKCACRRLMLLLSTERWQVQLEIIFAACEQEEGNTVGCSFGVGNALSFGSSNKE